MVDYSKWNNFKVSDSDSDSDDDTPFMGSNSKKMDNSMPNPATMFPSHYFSDPKKFVPVKSTYTGNLINYQIT